MNHTETVPQPRYEHRALIGGSFAPFHAGHLQLAMETRALLGVSQVDLIPCGLQPLKKVPFSDKQNQQRLRQIHQCIRHLPFIRINTIELETDDQPSYTIDTVSKIRADLSKEDALVFVMGSDCLPSLHLWKAWKQLLDHCYLLIFKRYDYCNDRELTEQSNSRQSVHGDDPELSELETVLDKTVLNKQVLRWFEQNALNQQEFVQRFHQACPRHGILVSPMQMPIDLSSTQLRQVANESLSKQRVKNSNQYDF